MTPQAEALYRAGRSSWTPNTSFDWVTDFDSWDRCVSRGFPASMLPFRYNNGIRIYQSPGYVMINLEMLGTRVIPIAGELAAMARSRSRPGSATAAATGKATRWSSRRPTSRPATAPRATSFARNGSAAQHGHARRAAVEHHPDQRAGQGGRAADDDRPEHDHLRDDLLGSRGVHRAVDRCGSTGRATTTTRSSNTPATRATCRCATTSPPRAPGGSRQPRPRTSRPRTEAGAVNAAYNGAR